MKDDELVELVKELEKANDDLGEANDFLWRKFQEADLRETEPVGGYVRGFVHGILGAFFVVILLGFFALG